MNLLLLNGNHNFQYNIIYLNDMKTIDYFTLTQFISDDVHFPNGDSKLNQLGGGTYTVAGQRLWSDKVGFCCCLGPDYEEKYSKWFIDNDIDMVARRLDKNCIHSTINYFEDGEREEINHPDCGSFSEMMAYFSDIPNIYKESKGMYFFIGDDDSYWTEALTWLKSYNGISCWEIKGDMCDKKYVDKISEYLKYIDLFSLNISEAKRITGKEDELEIIKYLKGMHADKFILRMGAKGAFTVDKNNIWHIPAVKTNVVDVTGGGNSSTGGFLVGYCESQGDIKYAGAIAATSSSFIINQWGVPTKLDDLKKQAIERFNSLNITRI